MINRKCERCKEITGTLHGGKKIKEEFLCEDCLQKELRVEKSNYHKRKKNKLHIFL